jgi:hypothetical protein
MRRWLILCLMCAVCAVAVAAQANFTSKKVDYTFELPSDLWKVVQEPDDLQKQAELIYGDRLDGYLKIRKEVVESGTTLDAFLRQEQDNKLSFLNGYVAGKQEHFDGKLDGLTFSYEYTQTGKKMAGRIYLLQVDKLTFYTLRFTGLQNKLAVIRNQTDTIARTFEITKK